MTLRGLFEETRVRLGAINNLQALLFVETLFHQLYVRQPID